MTSHDDTISVHLSEHETDLVLSALLEEAAGSQDDDWAADTITLAARIRGTAVTRWAGFLVSAGLYRPGLLDLLEETQ